MRGGYDAGFGTEQSLGEILHRDAVVRRLGAFIKNATRLFLDVLRVSLLLGWLLRRECHVLLTCVPLSRGLLPFNITAAISFQRLILTFRLYLAKKSRDILCKC